MDVHEYEGKVWRDLNNALCLIGVIPILAFIYLMFEKMTLFKTFIGIFAITIFMIGVVFGRQIIWELINKLIELNKKNSEMQEQLIEEKRLSAITQTVITLTHEINTPLMAVITGIELLKKKAESDDFIQDKLGVMKGQSEKISTVLKKMAKISKPSVTSVLTSTPCDSEMIDMDGSE